MARPTADTVEELPAVDRADSVAREAPVADRLAAVPVPTPVPAGHPWKGMLAGLEGRVVEDDGTPVPGMRVALLEVDSSMLFSVDLIGGEDPSIEVEETVTNAEGRFVLSGARGPAFHGLGLDLGGPRSTLRVIDQALPNGERTDLGDIVLAPYGVLTGRVLDEESLPVKGARIRVAPLPEEILKASAHEFRSDSLVGVSMLLSAGEGRGVIEVPTWVSRLIDRLPIPTTETDEDGTFRLEGVPLASVVGGVDKRGYVGVPLGPVDMSPGEVEVGDLVLTRGETIRGVVEDPYGEPVAGIEVFAGAELFPGMAAILQPCGVSDEDGNFELTGVPTATQYAAAARRSPHEPWGCSVTTDKDNVLIELEAKVQLTVNVRDEAGQPLSNARVQLAPGGELEGNTGFAELFMILPRRFNRGDVFTETEPGKYVCTEVTAGTYDVIVQVPGLARGQSFAEIYAAENEILVTCPVGQRIDVAVIDAVSKQPVRSARASLMRASATGFLRLAEKYTNRDGQVQLGPIRTNQPVSTSMIPFPENAMLVIQHPSYGDRSMELDPATPSLVVELEAGGVLAGRVHWGGAVPTRIYMVGVERQSDEGFLEMFYMPRFGLSDLAGEFELTNLTPGTYRIELIERFLNQDPLGIMNDDFSPVSLHSETVEIVNGETTRMEIDLSPTGRGTTARFTGRVRFAGSNVEGAEVEIRARERLTVVTDSWGRFETPAFAVEDSARVRIEADVTTLDQTERRMTLYQEWIQLTPDEVREIDLDLYPIPVPVRVVDPATGEPVAGATVTARHKNRGRYSSNDEDLETDSSGEVSVLVLEAGEFHLTAFAEGYAKSSTNVDVPLDGLSEPAVVNLQRSVPCSGRVEGIEPGGFSYVHVSREGSSGAGSMLSPPDFTFELEGLSEGKYKGWIYSKSERGKPIEFELGPDGDTNLVLFFEPETE